MSKSPSPPVDIVGIGASAGGLRALKALLDGLPPDTGAAYVIIVHLDPTQHSDLAAIVGEWTRMPVKLVRDQARLAANVVYVIAPDQALTISGFNIEAAPFSTPRGHRAPIDMFFRSIAAAPRAGIAVVLSGTGSDGAVGVAAVCERGGLVLAQTPEDAEADSMPRAAIAVGADVVLPASQLGPRIAELVRARAAVREDTIRPPSDLPLQAIFAYVREATGHDFSQYKRPTVLRRIARRMQISQRLDLESYALLLKKEPAESHLLFRDLLISVTRFFRDAAAFEALNRLAIAPLFAGDRPPGAIRAWVAACATGEEAYSIAMLLMEAADRFPAHRPAIQIFATDLDEQALAVARAGRYPKEIAADVSPSRLARFFTATDDAYQVNRELRDLIIFTNHDVLTDPPFARLDLISCRNLLIYLERMLQTRVCETFSYALKPGGFLFLGSSETTELQSSVFAPIDRDARLYQVKARARITVPTLSRSPPGARDFAAAPLAPRQRGAINPGELHKLALEAIAPPSILVDDRHRIINVSETAGRFLQHPAGTVTTDAGAVVRPELALDLRAGLHRAFEHDERTVTLPIPVALDGDLVSVVLLVRPSLSDTGALTATVFFLEGGPVDKDAIDASPSGGDLGTLASKLREELAATRTLLRVSREQYEEATDELRASNEELQSVNEEYRATAEELETSKEELQSINEELQTVNGELTIRLTMVSQANNDLLNLMAATDIATLFLDTDLAIKRFTPRATGIFNIHAGDEGRPLSDFSHRLEYPALISDAREVLSSLTPVERLVTSTDGRHFTTRLRPYRTTDDRIEGVVLTFFDDTEKHRAEAAFATRQKMLVAEMVHRAKNTLAVVQSLVSQSLRGAAVPKGAVAELLGRIASLSRSHDLLLTTDWKGADLIDLIEAQVLPHVAPSRVRIDGSPVLISPDHATPLGLVLNELVTNAAKHGSLSVPAGSVDISWRIELQKDRRVVLLSWIESGGPAVRQPTARGNGLRLIESSIPGSDVRLDFDSRGLRVSLTVQCA